jgi:F0F1-type ATP synthase membrane subunit b/b'
MHKFVFSLNRAAAGTLAAVGLLSLTTAPAWASETEHVPEISSLLFPTINFVLFFALIVYLYKRGGPAALQNYSQRIKEALKKAADIFRGADTEYQSALARLRNLEGEKLALQQQLEQEGEQIARIVVAAGQDKAESIDRDSSHQIENELAQAQKEVRAQVIKEAAARARLQLKKSITGEQDLELCRKALQRFSARS